MFYSIKTRAILKKNANITKTIKFDNLYFNSPKQPKYLPDLTNKVIKAYASEILSIHKSDLKIIIFLSLKFKDKTTNIRKNIDDISNNDFIKITESILIGKSRWFILCFISLR